jgi:hypothetical protein
MRQFVVKLVKIKQYFVRKPVACWQGGAGAMAPQLAILGEGRKNEKGAPNFESGREKTH